MPRGLEDQLLASVVGAEQPELEKTKNDLVQVNTPHPSHLSSDETVEYTFFAPETFRFIGQSMCLTKYFLVR